MKTKTTLLIVLLLTACAWRSSAQAAFDSSGDGKLSGAYYFRQIFSFSQTGDAINIQGTITFNGSGGYTVTNASLLDGASGTVTPVTFNNTSGSYVVSANGEGYLTAINPNYPNDQIIGLVSQGGVFIGSSTENSNLYNDLFIAAPVGSTATNATLNGAYTVAYMDPTYPGDALFTMTANGSGNIGNVNVTGYVATTSDPTASTASTETLSGVTYSFSNGAAQINFGGTAGSTLIAGTELLYISPDGNFIFGGSYNGFDMFVGVRAAATNPSNLDGLYYQAGLDLTESSNGNLLDSYYGSLQSFSQNMIGHQRVNSQQIYGGSSDFTYYDYLNLGTNSGGAALTDGSTLSDFTFGQNYAISPDATIRIGYGTGPYLGINVAFQAPAFNGSGVYLSPVGVVNAASSAPFTAFVSPGEFLTLYGSGLAPATNSSGVPFPTTLSGVQVLINQIPAPIYFVSPTQISAIVPYITAPGSVAQIQVINNGANSNIVTAFTGQTSAGVFTNSPVGGIGIAAAERPDFSIVSESNKAQLGETIAVYVAGMGGVNPQVADGTAAPSTTLSNTTSRPLVYLTDSSGNPAVQATVTFSGLAPGFAGLYQINFTVPAGLIAGDASLEIYSGVDSDTLEAYLPLSGTAAATGAARPNSNAQRPRLRRHRLASRQLSGNPQ